MLGASSTFPEPLELEDLFLKNKQCEYADTYAAIMALRFHGNEADIVSKKRLVKGLRHMLERPQLADLVGILALLLTPPGTATERLPLAPLQAFEVP